MALETHLTSKEIGALIDAAPTLRDKMIISFLADTGCRISELLQLKVHHIDFEQKMVLIPHLKPGIRKKCPTCGKSTGRRQNFCPKCGNDISKVVAEGDEERPGYSMSGNEHSTFASNTLRREEETESYSQWYSHGEVVEVHPLVLTYVADTSGGHSGAPVWRESFWWWLRGFSAIHAFPDPSWNAGPRLVSENRDLIEEWMEWVPSGVDGLVYDAYTGWPLSGAAVEVHETGKVAYTNSGGYYRIVLPPGSYTLTASYLTFYDKTYYNVQVVEGGLTQRHFSLDPKFPGYPIPLVIPDALEEGSTSP